MKTTILTLFTAVLLMTSCANKVEKVKSATVEELGQMNRDFAKAMNAQDAVAAANLYDENASILPPNEPMVTGRENIKKYMQGFLDAGYVSGSASTFAAESDGDLGYETGTFVIKMKGADGSITEETIKYIELLKRNNEGKWMSIYGMWSANEPEPSN
jgi:ketosteroid isomerase-like protein